MNGENTCQSLAVCNVLAVDGREKSYDLVLMQSDEQDGALEALARRRLQACSRRERSEGGVLDKTKAEIVYNSPVKDRV